MDINFYDIWMYRKLCVDGGFNLISQLFLGKERRTALSFGGGKSFFFIGRVATCTRHVNYSNHLQVSFNLVTSFKFENFMISLGNSAEEWKVEKVPRKMMAGATNKALEKQGLSRSRWRILFAKCNLRLSDHVANNIRLCIVRSFK